MIIGNREWLQPTTLGRTVDATLPLGKIYLPDSSYREMTEWALPAVRQTEYLDAVRHTVGEPAAERLKPFLRAGGFWRNFKARYPESDEMYARMLHISNRLAADGASCRSDPDYLDIARQELYRGQCNCPYWHGAFGGLYLPHLRNAIYHHLIAAENALDDAAGRTGPRVLIEAGDFNLDARQEVRLENDCLVALVRPATGGQIYELDVRHAQANVLATLERRPETYHQAIAAATGGSTGDYHGPASIQNRVILKQEGLDRLLVYDTTPRKALVDHFFPADVAVADLRACRARELGDFVSGAYLSKIQRGPKRVTLTMERPGWADGHAIHIRKTIELEAGSPVLDVHYVLEGLTPGATVQFAIEINLAAMAGHAHDRFYSDVAGRRLGMLDAVLDLPETEGVNLTDEWLDLGVGLRWSCPAGLWCFPIETVSQSEGGYEGVYQSSAVIPHWRVAADDARRWEVRIRWSLDRVARSTTAPSVPGTSRETLARSFADH
jgi:alpha-amylase